MRVKNTEMLTQRRLIDSLLQTPTFVMMSQSIGDTPAESILTWDKNVKQDNVAKTIMVAKHLSLCLITLLLELINDDALPSYGKHFDYARIVQHNTQIILSIVNDVKSLDAVSGFLGVNYGESLAHNVRERYNEMLNSFCAKNTKGLVHVDVGISELYYCHVCKSRRVVTMNKQTRSSDESATIFIKCLDCGSRFRISA